MGALHSPTKRMLTKLEAANYCGFQSIAGFEAAVPVAPVKIGSKLLFDQKALDEFLDRLSNPPEARRGFAARSGNVGSRERA